MVKAPGFITFLSAESLTFEAIATTVPEPSTWALSFMGGGLHGLPPSEHQRVPLGLIWVRRNWQAKSRLSGRLFVDLARMIGLWPSGDREISCADNWSATPRIAVGPPKSWRRGMTMRFLIILAVVCFFSEPSNPPAYFMCICRAKVQSEGT